jgi:hypothetical protein
MVPNLKPSVPRLRVRGVPPGLQRIAAVLLLLVAAGARPAAAEVASAPGGVLFSYRAPYAGSVALAGDFNGWSTTANPMTKDADGVWTLTVSLGPGEHQYKFVVDGQWIADPGNPVTAGDYGNSVVKVGTDGKVVQMKATSNTELSPKVYLGSRYVVIMQDQRTRGGNPQWDLARPDFDIDLHWNIRVNEDLSANLLTKINNQHENVQLWQTSLEFDRGNLLLQNEDINLIAFDNDSVGTFDDPLHLVGDIGIYHYAWGFQQQGAMAWRRFGDYQGKLLYSDNFNTGGTESPSSDPLIDDISRAMARNPDTTLVGSSAYSINRSDNAKNVLGARVKGPVPGVAGLTGGISYRLDRGEDPGAFVVVRDRTLAPGDTTVTADVYPGSIESWQAGGLDLEYSNEPAGIDLYGEFLVGDNWIATGQGNRNVYTYNNVNSSDVTFDRSAVTQATAPRTTERLDTSRRFKLGGEYYAYRGWHWTGSFTFQDEDLVDRSGEPVSRYNRMQVWDGGLRFDGGEWKDWPWNLGLDLTYYDFTYGDRSRWTDQFWFDDQNFWLETGEHLVTVDRLVMLGGDNVVSWKPYGSWTFYQPRNATVAYRGILNSTSLGRKPKYWGNHLTFHLDLTRRLGLNTDTRLAKYDDPVLNLHDTFTSHFVELKYHFTPDMEVGLSWGVDPWVIDGVTNEYAHIGRDLFLFNRGANGDAAKTQFLNMTNTIRAAEQALEDERVVQLEAILRF